MSMVVFPDSSAPKLIEMINGGAIGVVRTDTLYGLVARADNEAAVERIFQVKDRTPGKPLIVLISDISQLYDPLPAGIDATIGDLWPGKNSVIVPAPSAPQWLLRGGNGIAYRLPSDPTILRLLQATGPLVAPSANPEGKTPAKSVGEAQGYFGDTVDFYVDGGITVDSTPSRLFSLTADGDMEQLR